MKHDFGIDGGSGGVGGVGGVGGGTKTSDIAGGETEKYYLGIDGGGTKTKFLLANDLGEIRAEYTGPTTHYMQTGFEGLTAVLSEGLDQCLAQASIAASDIKRAYAGLGAYGEIPADNAPICEAAARGLRGIPLQVGNDGENALAGALGGSPGINVVAGTGSIAFGRNADGVLKRCGGWHQWLGGDEGSGYWFGQSLIHAFTRQSDGRDPKTLLYLRVREHFQLTDDFDLVRILITDWRYDRTRIANLSYLAVDLANDGDPYALSWFSDGAFYLAELAITLASELSLPAGSPVSGTGGMFKLDTLLLPPFRDHIEKAGLRYQDPLFPPDRGALILAMGAGDSGAGDGDGDGGGAGVE